MPDWQDELSATDHPVRFALVFGVVWGTIFGLSGMLISGGSWSAFVPALIFGLVVAGPGFALMTRRRARNLNTSPRNPQPRNASTTSRADTTDAPAATTASQTDAGTS